MSMTIRCFFGFSTSVALEKVLKMGRIIVQTVLLFLQYKLNIFNLCVFLYLIISSYKMECLVRCDINHNNNNKNN